VKSSFANITLEQRLIEKVKQQRKQFAESLTKRGMRFELGGTSGDYLVSISANPAGLPVTDADLKYLSDNVDSLMLLRKLNFADTKVTSSGIKILDEEQPGCEIIH
jgi:hypothetical protein